MEKGRNLDPLKILISTTIILTISTGARRKQHIITLMKQVPTVQQLRKAGFKVTVKHYRDFFTHCSRTGTRKTVQISWLHRSEEYKDYHLDARGGRTEVQFLDPNGGQYFGVSYCSVAERYCKKVGVLKAMARAYADYKADNPGN